MIWLVQNAMFGDEFGVDQFQAAIDATGDRRIQLDYVFWESTIDLKLTGVENLKDLIPFGTRSFTAYGMKEGWNVYWDKSFEYPSLLALGEDFINHDMTVGKLKDLVVPDSGKIYIREAAGFNIIKGTVINAYSWPDWVAGFAKRSEVLPTHHDWHPINEDSLFITAPIKPIYDEYRVWVIKGNVVTSSQYVKEGVISYHNTDAYWQMNNYAQMIADKIPYNMENYVLDIFRTDKGLRVGEINCIHCAGWYHVDSRKVVQALSN